MSNELTLEEVVEFRKRILSATKKFSPERQTYSNILYGYYDKLEDILITAQEDIAFLKGDN